MVRTPRLKLWLLAGLVLAGHLLALEWLGRQADAISGLPDLAPVMFTRMLQPAQPPPAVAAAPPPAPPRAAPKPKPKASEPRPPAAEAAVVEKAPESEALPPVMPPLPEIVAQAPEPAASAPEAVASAPEAVASAPAQAASEPASAASAPAQPQAPSAVALDTWPTDTRLTYRLGGDWRGPLYGNASVQWQREGGRYQVRLEVNVQPLFTQVLTSQGDVGADGLLPRAYEELRPGKRRAAQFGDEVLVFENGRTAPRPAGVQDTASQFVELTHRFATGKEVLEVGRSVQVWLARPGNVDLWTYDIVGREVLNTPKLGPIEAFHLKPRPIANSRGNITAEMWFAPTLLYLPVRIKVIMGTEAYLDLLVEHVEQR